MSVANDSQGLRGRQIAFLLITGVVYLGLTILVLVSNPGGFPLVFAITLGGALFGIIVGMGLVERDEQGVEHRLSRAERLREMPYAIIIFAACGYLIGLLGALASP